MDALERITGVSPTNPKSQWEFEDFRDAGNRAKQLWQTTEDLFEIQYGLLTDAVSVIDPQFQLPDCEVLAIRDSEMAKMVGGRNVAVSFVKWERCSATRGIDNPFEPLVEIFEHGGSMSKERGQFIDIYDSRGIAVTGLTF